VASTNGASIAPAVRSTSRRQRRRRPPSKPRGTRPQNESGARRMPFVFSSRLESRACKPCHGSGS
jgi:hypothetical protein